MRELEQILDRIKSAKGLGSRLRTSHDDVDKIRKSVSEAIRRAILLIRGQDPSLADHLHKHIHLGRDLSYSGDLAWEFHVKDS